MKTADAASAGRQDSHSGRHGLRYLRAPRLRGALRVGPRDRGGLDRRVHAQGPPLGRGGPGNPRAGGQCRGGPSDLIEHAPLAYPLLACAAARLVPETAQPDAAGVGDAGGRRGWTGLTERARRAAVEVLRPLALSTLVRAATWDLVEQARA